MSALKQSSEDNSSLPRLRRPPRAIISPPILHTLFENLAKVGVSQYESDVHFSPFRGKRLQRSIVRPLLSTCC